MRSRLEPINKLVGRLRRHEELLMNWLKAEKEYEALEGRCTCFCPS